MACSCGGRSLYIWAFLNTYIKTFVDLLVACSPQTARISVYQTRCLSLFCEWYARGMWLQFPAMPFKTMQHLDMMRRLKTSFEKLQISRSNCSTRGRCDQRKRMKKLSAFLSQFLKRNAGCAGFSSRKPFISQRYYLFPTIINVKQLWNYRNS